MLLGFRLKGVLKVENLRLTGNETGGTRDDTTMQT